MSGLTKKKPLSIEPWESEKHFLKSDVNGKKRCTCYLESLEQNMPSHVKANGNIESDYMEERFGW